MAWDQAGKFEVDPVLCFLHPRVLAEQPSLLLYYRCVALLSQKGLQSLCGVSPSSIETGRQTKIPQEARMKIVGAVNSVLSVLMASLDRLKTEHLKAFLYATAGTQIQGSWNNAVGEQGETVVKEIVVACLWEEVVQVVWKNDSTTSKPELALEDLRARALEIKVLRLTDGFHCVFSTEPDISLRAPDERPLIAVEVKAGIDPAGALERLGAAMKSFENERSMNPRMKTVYVASCITDEVRNRIDQTKPFDRTFLLPTLLSDATTQKRFAGLFVREIVGSQSKRD